jgi:hypothetical protein
MMVGAIRKEDEPAEAGAEDVAEAVDEVEEGDTIVVPTQQPNNNRADMAAVCLE